MQINLPTSATRAAETPLIARFGSDVDLSKFDSIPRGPERREAVYEALTADAKSRQSNAVQKLEAMRDEGLITDFESMFLPNAIIVTPSHGSSNAVTQALRGVADITDVTPNKKFSVSSTSTGKSGIDDATFGANELGSGPTWGVNITRAPEAWKKGANGEGITVGVVDSGVDTKHPAIAPHYRGTQPDGTQNHDYAWFDPIYGSKEANDADTHGTHVAGTIAGGTIDGPQIGVAPGAKIIAARANQSDGYNTSVAALKALQWMLAPTKIDGSAPDAKKGADVINNSWGNDIDRHDPTFEETFAGLRAAGTVVVSAAGNAGRRGNDTVGAPGIYPGYLSVAASTDRDQIARFSSRGKPGSEKHPDTMTPNISAPGSNVLSSVPGGRYASYDGTSMASPHVAGAVADLLSKYPNASVEAIRQALFGSAVDIDTQGPDISSGYGRIDIEAALERLDASVAKK